LQPARRAVVEQPISNGPFPLMMMEKEDLHRPLASKTGFKHKK
jgi:hypothetical protein